MSIRHIRVSRRSMAVGFAAVIGLVSLALGAHAALNLHSSETEKPASIASAASLTPASKLTSTRVALVIGNGRYPDATTPMTQPAHDARALASALREQGFEVDAIEDATRADMLRGLDRLQARITPETVVTVFFSGYGIQSGRESYMIPVDAVIWKEADVRRNGISVEAMLADLSERGAKAKFAIIDASRRNPYERRFRQYSHGLAPIDAPANSLVMSSATPGQLVDDAAREGGLMARALIDNLKTNDATAETVFNRARIAVSRETSGAQAPSVSSSLVEDIRIGLAQTQSSN